MPRKPVVFRNTRWVHFSELDLYHHVGTGRYAAWYVDHRMQGLREHIGWDVASLAALPYAIWVRRLEIDFVRPVLADQEVIMTSSVREFNGPDATIDCTMTNASGTVLSRAVMTATCVDKATSRSTPWPDEAIDLFYENQ